MSVESYCDTGDLRGQAKDIKRNHDKKHKWALGGRPANGTRMEYLAPESTVTRPMMPNNSAAATRRGNNQGNINKIAAGIRLQFRHDVADELMHPSDCSTDEDIREASAAPEPDVDITYSYDAPRGPGKGSEILSMALAQAVEKFETKETEKLIKNEYEVVGKEHEDKDGYTADDDDFELV